MLGLCSLCELNNIIIAVLSMLLYSTHGNTPVAASHYAHEYNQTPTSPLGTISMIKLQSTTTAGAMRRDGLSGFDC